MNVQLLSSITGLLFYPLICLICRIFRLDSSDAKIMKIVCIPMSLFFITLGNLEVFAHVYFH